MNKVGAIAITVGVVGILYLLLLVIMPFLADTASTANTTIATTTTGNYEASQNFLLASPLILFFVPGMIGIVMVVMILRQKA